MPTFRSLCALLALLPLTARADTPTEDALVREYLDPVTAMTVRLVAEPFVYAREVPELAVNARDYLTVGPVELNNMGTRRYYLALVAWSTIDRDRIGAPTPPLPERVEMALSGKDRELQSETHTPRELGSGLPVYAPPVGRLGESWLSVKPADLRAFSASPPETFDVVVDGTRLRYTLWRKEPKPLEAFVGSIPETLTPIHRRRR
jgi:hypothetical protein